MRGKSAAVVGAAFMAVGLIYGAAASCAQSVEKEAVNAGGAGDSEETGSLTCPACGVTGDVIPVIYGKPGRELLDRAERGEVELAG